jgi:hypothetical protein
MFILNFIVMFNIKKGSIVAYKSGWSSLLSTQILLVFNNFTKETINSKVRLFMYQFHFTTITSRSTSYFLFTFWLFFFFFGEFLLLLTFNYTTPIDTITSHTFFIIKQHTIFLTNSLSIKLATAINFYIYFLTSLSLIFLINLNFIYNYNFFRQNMLFISVPFIIFFLML